MGLRYIFLEFSVYTADCSQNYSNIQNVPQQDDTVHMRYKLKYNTNCVGPVAQSVQRLSYGMEDPGSNPGVGRDFPPRPNRTWDPPSLLYNGYRVIPGGKVRPGRAADHSPPSSAAVMEKQSYTSTHPLGHTGPVTGSLYLYLYIKTSIAICNISRI